MSVAIWVGLALSAAPADPCRRPPVEVVRAVPASWRMLTLSDLHPDDRRLWLQARPGVCPGFSVVKLSAKSAPAFAVAMVRPSAKGQREKAVLVAGRSWVLADREVGGAPFVVWRAGPGPTQAWDGGPVIQVRWDSVVVEKLEASAVQFYLDEGRLRSVVTSD